MSVISFLAFFAFAIADWIAVSNERTHIEYIVKPAALAALLVYALTGHHPSAWLIAALAFSLLGDVYLMLPVNLFIAGMVAFFFAHIAYIGALDASSGWRLVWWILVIAASGPIAARIARAIREPELRVAVLAYTAVLTLMVASALASGRLVAAVGALLFLASDSIIAWNRFVQPLGWAQPTIMIAYHLGQLGLVIALR